MNEKAYRVLEYSKIIDMLSEMASSEVTKDEILKMLPQTNAYEVKNSLKETDEASEIINKKGAPPLGSFNEIKEPVKRAEKGGQLSARQLLDILVNLKASRATSNFLKTEEIPLGVVKDLAGLLTPQKAIQEEIERCIAGPDEIADAASPRLRDIRRSIVRNSESARAKLNSIISSSRNKTMLSDTIITVRQGRYVIPVKQEYKDKFPGIIHDKSSTGATFFIEPQSIVNFNNELRELELSEAVEIDRILAELSSEVASEAEEIIADQDILMRLDFIFSKGKLSVTNNCISPIITDNGVLDLIAARHPLISNDKVVPISLKLGGSYNSLIVTGPNTGGKTVTLKTAGLLQMMAQSGLHVPAQEGTKMPIFAKIYADIGDEQSIEQSLSTFSSHMKNIVEIVENADSNTLVLLDELGAGTDPTEGAALAISILENMYTVGAKTIATTHYTELKKYAVVTAGIENASVEFDVDTLSPTYRLFIGIPGKSNAFLISEKLGLPKNLIEKAKRLLGNKDVKFEDVLNKIETDKKTAEVERDEAITLNLQMKKQKEEIDLQLNRISIQKEKIIEKAKEEAKDLMSDAKNLLLEMQNEIRLLSEIDNAKDRNKKYEEIRKKVKEKADKFRGSTRNEINEYEPIKAEELKLDDKVKIISLDQKGHILTLPDGKGELQVQIGLLKVNVKLSDISKIEESQGKKVKSKSAYGSLYSSKVANISTNMHLRGMTLDEAIIELDKYLDDAYIAGLNQVTVVHGKGEGVLKAGLREFLKKHNLVDSFKGASLSDGGEGATVVYLKV